MDLMSRTGTPPPSTHHAVKLKTAVSSSRGRDSGFPSAAGGDPGDAPNTAVASAPRSPSFPPLPSFHQHLWSDTFFQ